MNTKKWLLLLLPFLWPLGACIDWSLDQPAPGPIDCSLYSDAAQRYPGICGLDGGASTDGGSDAQAADGGAGDGR